MQACSQIRKVEQTFDFPTGSFARISKERGPDFAEAIIAIAITELVQDLNLGNTMSDRQIIKAARLLLEEFKLLNPADVSLCFDQMRLGKFGEYYNRMDIQILSRSLKLYFDERIEIAESLSDKQHTEDKKDIVLPANMPSREEFYRNAGDLFNKIEKNAEEDKDDGYEAFKAEYYRKQNLENGGKDE